MLAAAFDAIIGPDHAGRIIELNPAAERLFGHSLVEATGQQMAELLIAPVSCSDFRVDIASLHPTEAGPVLEGHSAYELLTAMDGCSGLEMAREHQSALNLG